VDLQAYIQSGVVESYVLGLAEDQEVVEIEQLIVQYPVIQLAIDEFAIALEKEAFENSLTPPGFIKQKLMAELAFSYKNNDKANPLMIAYNSQNENTTGQYQGKSSTYWKILAAASVILFFVSAAANFYLYNKYNTTNNKYTALLNERNLLQASNQVIQAKVNNYQLATAMMANPAIVTVQMTDPSLKENNMTTVFWDKSNKKVYLLTNKLPLPGPNKQYQLWALVNNVPVNAGLLDPTCTSLCKMKNVDDAQAFAITLENKGGSETPNLGQLFVLGKI